MRKSIVALFVVALLALTSVIDMAAQPTELNNIIRVEALIDGRSQLILQGNTAQWHHFDFAAPGRHLFVNEPTVINGVEWYPAWPDIPDEENRDCNCFSDVFTGVMPALPQTNMTVELNTIQSRYNSHIVQLPLPDNDYTLIIEFDDNPLSGSAIYIVEIVYTVQVQVLFISSNSGGTADGIQFADEDILTYDTATNIWGIYFDGSDVGLRGTDVDALHVLDDGSILMSFNFPIMLPGIGQVEDTDIVHFIPTSLGEDTAGTWAWFFDGSDVGLRNYGEDVDAIGFAPDGRLVVSTSASFEVPKTGGGILLGTDDDLLVFNGTLGSNTRGRWELYFHGADVWDLTEDIWGTWLDTATGDIYLSLQSDFTAGGISGDALDVFVCHPDSLGEATACTFEMVFDGSVEGFGGAQIDGLAIEN